MMVPSSGEYPKVEGWEGSNVLFVIQGHRVQVVQLLSLEVYFQVQVLVY